MEVPNRKYPYRCGSIITMLLAIGMNMSNGCSPQGPQMTFVRYSSGFSFSGDGKEFDRLWTLEKLRDQKTDIYVRTTKGEVYNVRELQEEMFKEWVEQETEPFTKDQMVDRVKHNDRLTNLYVHPDRSLFFFDDVGLVDCNFGITTKGPFAGIEVGKTKDGEFLKLPASYEDIVRVFGKPDEQTTAKLGT